MTDPFNGNAGCDDRIRASHRDHRVTTSRRSGRIVPRAFAAVALALCFSQPARADCFDSAGTYQGVNPLVLRAIAWVESRGNPAAVHHNANGSTDIGELQINSVHLRELATYGINAQGLRDECVNIYVAAWHLKKQMVKYGNTWDAVGAYHSESPPLRDAYAQMVKTTLVRRGLMASSPLSPNQ
ncbi:lytic transglycosylase domain-containing protein [Paraburkholderia metrosideri]|uniref:Lytic transglycosylase domain-containing protein n=1 Tax=Paraburkholderia metrosideri TaxID=580937 RepID=A0ABW9DMY3_9BURK